MKNIGESRHAIQLEPQSYEQLSEYLNELKDSDQIKSMKDERTSPIYLNAPKSSVKQFFKNYLTPNGRKRMADEHAMTRKILIGLLGTKFPDPDIRAHIKAAGISKSTGITAGLLRKVITSLEKESPKPPVTNVEPVIIPTRRNSLT